MEIKDVLERVEAIRSEADDAEVAHGMEDALHQDVLKFLADQGNELAKAALLTWEISFPRWCA
jgi:hypothetical protein